MEGNKQIPPSDWVIQKLADLTVNLNELKDRFVQLEKDFDDSKLAKQ